MTNGTRQTSTAVARSEAAAAVVHRDGSVGMTVGESWTAGQVAVIKATIAPKASDPELALFALVCKRTGLDPFLRQIWMLPVWDRELNANRLQVQIGIDGYRLIAERTGKYDGIEGPEWCGEDGQWREVWTESKPPVAARAKVYRKDVSRPFVAVAPWQQWARRGKDGQPLATWRDMPAHMLGVRAQTLAFRMAFPAETAGLDDDGVGEPPPERRLPPATLDDLYPPAEPERERAVSPAFRARTEAPQQTAMVVPGAAPKPPEWEVYRPASAPAETAGAPLVDADTGEVLGELDREPDAEPVERVSSDDLNALLAEAKATGRTSVQVVQWAKRSYGVSLRDLSASQCAEMRFAIASEEAGTVEVA